VILALGISSTLALAQSAGLQFDVVSVKISPPMDPQAFMVRPGSPDPDGRWAARNATMFMLVQGAYPDYRRPGMIVGGASWVNERRFDIDAKAAATPSRDDHLHMVRLDFAATRTTNLAALDDTAGGSVFTAVQEQLGLKLERRREMTDVLVIDSVEMPSEN
jgi:hypothetical protein